MKVLVTGGAGYIGSHIVDHFVKSGISCVVADNLSTGHREMVHPSANLEVVDLMDVKEVQNLFNTYRFDAVIHLASHTLVGESVTNPWMYMRENYVTASNVLECAINHDISDYIFASTANLFSTRGQFTSIKPTDTILPGSPYGESKYIIERMLDWAKQLYNINYVVLRYFNVGGAQLDSKIGECHSPETHLIPSVLLNLPYQNKTVQIFGNEYPTADGTCIRDYVHVMDLAQAHLSALKYMEKGNSGQFNIGTGRGTSVLEVLEAIEKITKRNINYEVVDCRQGDPAYLVANIESAIRDLQWIPTLSLDNIIESAWHWHNSNQFTMLYSKYNKQKV